MSENLKKMFKSKPRICSICKETVQKGNYVIRFWQNYKSIIICKKKTCQDEASLKISEQL